MFVKSCYPQSYPCLSLFYLTLVRHISSNDKFNNSLLLGFVVYLNYFILRVN
jgi:hypothetical protein